MKYLIIIFLPVFVFSQDKNQAANSKPVKKIEAESKTPEPTEKEKSFLSGFLLFKKSETKLNPVPNEFKKTMYQIKKVVAGKKIVVIDLSVNRSTVKPDTKFYAFINSKKSTCTLTVISIEKGLALLDSKSCPNFYEIKVNDYLILQTPLTEKKWSTSLKLNFIAGSASLNTWEADNSGVTSSGSGLLYSANGSTMWSDQNRILYSYSVGTNDAGSPSDSVTESDSGVFLGDFNILVNHKRKWAYHTKNINFIPLIGLGSLTLNSKGSRTDGTTFLKANMIGPSLGLTIISKKYETHLDLAVSFCLSVCSVSEVFSGSTYIYHNPGILNFSLQGNSQMFNTNNLGFYYKIQSINISGSKAYDSTGSLANRSFNNKQFLLSTGLSYFW